MKLNHNVVNAINSFTGLMNYKKSQNSIFKKSTSAPINFNGFRFGDNIYYSEKYGYTNNPNLGKQRGICICDEPGEEMYIAFNNELLNETHPWANAFSDMETADVETTKDNGLCNTKYIKDNYSKLQGTIWSYLGLDEYIPSILELQKIKSIYQKNAAAFNGIIDTVAYWSSTLSDYTDKEYGHTDAIRLYFGRGLGEEDHWLKNEPHSTIPLLRIQ